MHVSRWQNLQQQRCVIRTFLLCIFIQLVFILHYAFSAVGYHKWCLLIVSNLLSLISSLDIHFQVSGQIPVFRYKLIQIHTHFWIKLTQVVFILHLYSKTEQDNLLISALVRDLPCKIKYQQIFDLGWVGAVRPTGLHVNSLLKKTKNPQLDKESENTKLLVSTAT